MSRPKRPPMVSPSITPSAPAAQEKRVPSEARLEAFYNAAPDAKPPSGQQVAGDQQSNRHQVGGKQISSSSLVAGKPKKPRQTTQKVSLGVRLDLLPLVDEFAALRHMDRSKYVNYALAEQIKRDREEFED